ncbi:uncharacterized protein LOC135844396 isoform X5 [Planococcus citri]|uniref:uncharacterized protein LOC135844396 isoform X5 n=1 Tax=Planococcus citri TaxID=170843 RepID=UPI0031F800BA
MYSPMYEWSDEDSIIDSEFEARDLEHGDCKPVSVPRLETMASVSVAIALWDHVSVKIPPLIRSNPYDRLKAKILKWIDVLPMPKLLSESIERYSHALLYNVSCWLSYVSEEVFAWRVERSVRYQLVNYIIWHSSGTINSAETARNILKSDILTITMKFLLACKYCLREEIEKMWPTVKDDDDLVDEIWPTVNDDDDLVRQFRYSEYALVYYWRYYCAGNLDKIQTPENTSVDEFMIKQWSVNNCLAIEYFFDRLDAEKQITLTIWSIDNRESSLQKLLLAKLDESQRQRVIIDKGVKIIKNYILYGNAIGNVGDLTIATWYELRDLITEKQFVKLISTLLRNYGEDFVLTEIWNSARDDFKRHTILKYGDDGFIRKILEWCVLYRPKRSCTFLSVVLMDHFSADIRREIMKNASFSKWCERLICRDAAEALDHLINSCFPTAEESIKFKLTLTKTSYFAKHCKSLVNYHRTQELANLLNVVFPKTDPSSIHLVRKSLNKYLKNFDQKFLTYYMTGNVKTLIDLLAPLASSYPEIISNYKSKLLMSRAGFKVCLKLFESTNNALVEIIADGIPANQAAEFKKRIICSYEGIDKLQNMLIKGHSIKAKEWACLFLESDSDKNIVRTLLINRLKERKRDVSTKTRKRFLEFLL